MLAVDLAGNSVPQVPPRLRRPVPPSERVDRRRPPAPRARARGARSQRDRGGVAEALRANIVEHLRAEPTPVARIPDELLSGNARIDATLENLVAQATVPDEVAPAQRVFDQVAAASRVLAESQATLRVRPQLRIDAGEFAGLAAISCVRIGFVRARNAQENASGNGQTGRRILSGLGQASLSRDRRRDRGGHSQRAACTVRPSAAAAQARSPRSISISPPLLAAMWRRRSAA